MLRGSGGVLVSDIIIAQDVAVYIFTMANTVRCTVCITAVVRVDKNNIMFVLRSPKFLYLVVESRTSHMPILEPDG